MEKLREWFGTPAAAAKTVGWVWWMGLVVGIVASFVVLAIAGLWATFK